MNNAYFLQGPLVWRRRMKLWNVSEGCLNVSAGLCSHCHSGLAEDEQHIFVTPLVRSRRCIQNVNVSSRRVHKPYNIYQQCRNHSSDCRLLMRIMFHYKSFWLQLCFMKSSCLKIDGSVCFQGRKVWPICWWEKAAQWAGWKLGHQADVGGECTHIPHDLFIYLFFTHFKARTFKATGLFKSIRAIQSWLGRFLLALLNKIPTAQQAEGCLLLHIYSLHSSKTIDGI